MFTKVGLVVCPNRDNWHKGVYVSYVIWDTHMLDDPTYDACMAIVEGGNRELVVIERTCFHCRKRLRQPK